jgi:hypothetical protein
MRILLLLFCLFVNLQEILIVKTGFSWLGYIDEVFMFLPYVFLPLLVKRKLDAWIYVVLLAPFISIFYGLCVNYINYSELYFFKVVAQSFINFKLFLYFVLFYIVWRFFARSDRLYFPRVFSYCVALSLLGYVLNIIFPSYFIFSENVWHLERSRIPGFQFKPNDLAILLGMALLFSLCLKSAVDKKVMIVLGFFMLVFFTSSRTALLFSSALIFTVLVKRGYFNHVIGGVFITFVALLFYYDDFVGSFVFSETISNLNEFKSIESSQYIRAIMLYLGAKLAIANFPFGVGAGNFGTVMSVDSPVYQEMGVANSYFFSNAIGIYDSNIASIMGEYGVFGVVVFSVLLWKILTRSLGVNAEQRFLLLLLALFIVFSQPLFSYQVNSINFLLLVYSLRSIGEGGWHTIVHTRLVVK